jgi:hypothetical protein
MKRMYEFVCESGHRIERYCDYEAQETQCECGGSANTQSLLQALTWKVGRVIFHLHG